MYVAVRNSDGTFYKSPVFGILNYGDEDNNGVKYIVLTADKKGFMKFSEWDDCLPRRYNPRLIFIDHHEDWSKQVGNSYLKEYMPEDIDGLIDMERVPEIVLARCLAEDMLYPDSDIYSVNTNEDGENLLWSAGHFHDGYIKEFRVDNDCLYLHFSGLWTCDIEIWLEDELRYKLEEDREPTGDNRWWFGAKVCIKDGYVILCDDDDYDDPDVDTEKCYTWFRAKTLKYRLVIS